MSSHRRFYHQKIEMDIVSQEVPADIEAISQKLIKEVADQGKHGRPYHTNPEQIDGEEAARRLRRLGVPAEEFGLNEDGSDMDVPPSNLRSK